MNLAFGFSIEETQDNNTDKNCRVPASNRKAATTMMRGAMIRSDLSRVDDKCN